MVVRCGRQLDGAQQIGDLSRVGPGEGHLRTLHDRSGRRGDDLAHAIDELAPAGSDGTAGKPLTRTI